MQTTNQSLASLHMAGKITIETAMLASSNREELQEMINRGVGVVQGAGLNRPNLRPQVAQRVQTLRAGRRARPPRRSRRRRRALLDGPTADIAGEVPEDQMPTFAFTGRTGPARTSPASESPTRSTP